MIQFVETNKQTPFTRWAATFPQPRTGVEGRPGASAARVARASPDLPAGLHRFAVTLSLKLEKTLSETCFDHGFHNPQKKGASVTAPSGYRGWSAFCFLFLASKIS